ncbi:hypothetical protein AK812_SmicGene45313 [Symbiodinium microadriaticum]|uniref:Uncharacterized protein n=1 Tax=Symbiodinium microadriaticum TaxID=2951 RepID=A0A1Q9BWL7_SYMMI|nr:hypothetical protein AK812_SmicGene45313 [Symbiodinium microadriaticum]
MTRIPREERDDFTEASIDLADFAREVGIIGSRPFDAINGSLRISRGFATRHPVRDRLACGHLISRQATARNGRSCFFIRHPATSIHRPSAIRASKSDFGLNHQAPSQASDNFLTVENFANEFSIIRKFPSRRLLVGQHIDLTRPAALERARSSVYWDDRHCTKRKGNSSCPIIQPREPHARLVRTVGFPKAQVRLPGEDTTATATCFQDIVELLGNDPALDGLRLKAEADLAEHKARWDAEDRRLGYSLIKRTELSTAKRAQDLFDTLMTTPATTLAGIVGKLNALLDEGATSEGCEEFPWPQLRAALDDLIRITKVLQPGMLVPGHNRTEPQQKRKPSACNSRSREQATGRSVPDLAEP